jgi:hypothetical protein
LFFFFSSTHPPCDKKHFAVEWMTWNIGIGFTTSILGGGPWISYGIKFALYIPRFQIRMLDKQQQRQRLLADKLEFFGEGDLTLGLEEGFETTVIGGLICEAGW